MFNLMKNIFIYYTLCKNKKSAKKLALLLLKKKKAVCINILNNVESFYCEKNKVKSENEVGVLIKSSIEQKEIFNFVEKNHSYEIPFISKLKTSKVNKKYIEWSSKK